MYEAEAENQEWLRGGCHHERYRGPVTDMLLRRCEVLCVKCWKLEYVAWELARTYPQWTDHEYEQHKDEVERRFFS